MSLRLLMTRFNVTTPKTVKSSLTTTLHVPHQHAATDFAIQRVLHSSRFTKRLMDYLALRQHDLPFKCNTVDVCGTQSILRALTSMVHFYILAISAPYNDMLLCPIRADQQRTLKHQTSALDCTLSK